MFPFGEPEAFSSRSFDGGSLHVQATPFTTSVDAVSDHLKYLAVSNDRFPIPPRGSLSVAAEIEALTPGTSPGHVVPTTGRVLLEGQQAAATLHLLDTTETGQLFDWFVSEHKAFALYERLFIGVGLDKGYTQITGAPNNNHADKPLGGKTASSKSSTLTPGPHQYEIRYSGGGDSNGSDLAEWLIDAVVRARVRHIGVPLDVQNPGYYRNANTITYPSAGPGETLKDKGDDFEIGHGIFSLVDEFPFNQFPDHTVDPAQRTDLRPRLRRQLRRLHRHHRNHRLATSTHKPDRARLRHHSPGRSRARQPRLADRRDPDAASTGLRKTCMTDRIGSRREHKAERRAHSRHDRGLFGRLGLGGYHPRRKCSRTRGSDSPSALHPTGPGSGARPRLVHVSRSTGLRASPCSRSAQSDQRCLSPWPPRTSCDPNDNSSRATRAYSLLNATRESDPSPQ